MAQITYENKVKINDSSLPAINKVRDVDMNEIKDVVNENYEEQQNMIIGGGNYTKFSDGTLIVWGNVGPFDINTSTGKQNVITLPESYKDTDFSVIASVKHGGAYWTSAHIKAEATSTNEINIEIYNDNPTNIVRNVSTSYFTVGKWK